MLKTAAMIFKTALYHPSSFRVAPISLARASSCIVRVTLDMTLIRTSLYGLGTGQRAAKIISLYGIYSDKATNSTPAQHSSISDHVSFLNYSSLKNQIIVASETRPIPNESIIPYVLKYKYQTILFIVNGILGLL